VFNTPSEENGTFVYYKPFLNKGPDPEYPPVVVNAYDPYRWMEDWCPASNMGIISTTSVCGPVSRTEDKRTGQTVVCVNPAFYRSAEVDPLVGDSEGREGARLDREDHPRRLGRGDGESRSPTRPTRPFGNLT
jgi:hypothetical protein